MNDRPVTSAAGQDAPADAASLLRECQSLRQELETARAREAAALASAVHWRTMAVRRWALAGAGTADRREVVVLRERSDHLEAELERTHATVSWRLTAPLRRVRGLRAQRPAR